MKFGRIFAALVLTLVACSSKTSTTQDPGLAGDGDSTAATAPDKNPDGVAYPTDSIGTHARQGNKPGDRIQNFKFLGYPDGNPANGLKPISLADFYDPTGAKYKLIHIQASGSWCIHCVNEIKAVSTIKADLDSRKAVWIVSLAEGDVVGEPSTQKDLDLWLQTYKPPYTHLLDPGNHNLGPFYDDAALPWNANISAKTMEILSAGVGAVETTKGILAEVDEYLPQVDSGGLPQ
jgi:hypothetical protein